MKKWGWNHPFNPKENIMNCMTNPYPDDDEVMEPQFVIEPPPSDTCEQYQMEGEAFPDCPQQEECWEEDEEIWRLEQELDKIIRGFAEGYHE